MEKLKQECTVVDIVGLPLKLHVIFEGLAETQKKSQLSAF
jgi:hypothetical protein